MFQSIAFAVGANQQYLARTSKQFRAMLKIAKDAYLYFRAVRMQKQKVRDQRRRCMDRMDGVVVVFDVPRPPPILC